MPDYVLAITIPVGNVDSGLSPSTIETFKRLVVALDPSATFNGVLVNLNDAGVPTLIKHPSTGAILSLTVASEEEEEEGVERDPRYTDQTLIGHGMATALHVEWRRTAHDVSDHARHQFTEAVLGSHYRWNRGGMTIGQASRLFDRMAGNERRR